jgi:hypothetical protein
MQEYERLGLFYLGRPYDLQARQAAPQPLLYDARDLVTHAVVAGMTGSGKTGLGITLVEEAAIDGVPSLVIDPKGDLTNLLLTFPDLRAESFEPWVNPDDAARKGLTVGAYAAEQADTWKNGLVAWGQDGDRIRRLREAADFTVFTPGSRAGVPLSIVTSFAAPGRALLEESDLLRERVATTVTSLLSLIGIQADPIRSREHILLSTILEHAWRQERDLELGTIIQAIQSPPVARVGVLDVETFYPSRDRFALAMALNNLLASPGFDVWTEGEALDVGRLLHGPDGRPRVSIVSIAHLGDAERMFFVALLLNQALGWVRAQQGTTSLRALLYMDEVFGFLPPVANPPSKAPLLTLVKQARAFGLGLVLATQNPVDLDYKGLSNTGTWFLGRLQTERDKLRVLDGLEGVTGAAGGSFDRAAMDAILSGLASRVFLMHNVHEPAPQVFQTRWTMSYLRGPLGREEIKRLSGATHPRAEAAAATAAASPIGAPPVATPAAAATTPAAASPRPVLPPDVPQFFAPARGVRPSGGAVTYDPLILGSALVRFRDAKAGVDAQDVLTVVAPVTGEAIAVDWSTAREADFAVSDLEKAPEEPAAFDDLPPAAARAKSYETWARSFASWVYGTGALGLLRSPTTGLVSNAGETERDFRIRLQQAARERRDEEVDRLRENYAPKLAALQERLRRAQQAMEREAEQASQQKMQTAISFGATLLGAVLGRKTVSTSTLGRATTAARGVGRAMKESQDVGRARNTVGGVQQQIGELDARVQEEIAALEAKLTATTEALIPVRIKPRKTDIQVQLVALVWVPR